MPKKDGGWLLPEVIDPPMRCVSFEIPDDQNHMMAFWGALNELTYWFNWQRDDAHTASPVAYKWQTIIQAAHDRFLSENPCGNEIPTDDCRDLAPHHPAIEWYPHNPYTNPNWTGPGYAIGAWYVAQDAGLIDATPGSVVTDIAHVRVGVGDNAEFRLKVTGTGEVELHLANVFSGGMGIIRVDGAIVDSVDMSQDATSVPPETENVTIWEWAFTTPGAHEIIVNLVPVADDSLTPPFRYGGGLVKVSLCGFAPMEANNVIRVQDCILQQSADGLTWTDVADLTACMPAGPQGEPGTPGQDGASPEIRVDSGYIQWRQDDDDPTWTNLVSLASLTGPQGEPGADGAIGPVGPQGEPGTAGGNTYPPAPVTGDETCNAAAYIAERVRDLIVDVYSQIATLEPGEVLSSLLNMGGWSTAALYDLITTGQESLASETAVLATYDANKSALIYQLKTHALNQEYILSWIDSNFASDPVVRDMTKFSVQSAAADGRYGLWISVGRITPSAECVEIPTCTDIVYDTSTGGHTGLATGINVSAGDVITFNDVSGSYVPFVGGGTVGLGGVGSPQAQYMAENHPPYALMVQIQGEGPRVWHTITNPMTWTAPIAGQIKIAMNEYYGGSPGGAPGQYSDNVGTFEMEICVEHGEARLEEYDKCIRTGPGEYDLVTVDNFDYQSGGAAAEDNVPFKITAYEWLAPEGVPDTGYVTINGVNYQPDEIPLNVAMTLIVFYLTGPGTCHVSIERA